MSFIVGDEHKRVFPVLISSRAMPNYPSHILELAKRGAEHRYQELKADIESLVKLFPHLRGHSAGPLSAPVETVKRAFRPRPPVACRPADPTVASTPAQRLTD